MFGKGKRTMSSNDRFLMDAGRRAGNLPASPVKKIKPDAPPGHGKADDRGKHMAHKMTAPLVTIAKGQKSVAPVDSLAPRTINRSQVRFPATKLAGRFGNGSTQGGRKS